MHAAFEFRGFRQIHGNRAPWEGLPNDVKVVHRSLGVRLQHICDVWLKNLRVLNQYCDSDSELEPGAQVQDHGGAGSIDNLQIRTRNMMYMLHYYCLLPVVYYYYCYPVLLAS